MTPESVVGMFALFNRVAVMLHNLTGAPARAPTPYDEGRTMHETLLELLHAAGSGELASWPVEKLTRTLSIATHASQADLADAAIFLITRSARSLMAAREVCAVAGLAAARGDAPPQ